LELQAQILLDQGVKFRRQGKEAEARSIFERRIQLCDALGNHAEAIDGYTDLALQSLETGETEQARGPIYRGLVLVRKHRNLDLLAVLRVCRVRYAHATRDTRRLSRLIKRVGDSLTWMSSDPRKLSVLGHLAEVQSSLAAYDEAAEAYEQAVKIAIVADRPYSAVRLILGLASDQLAQGELDVAAKLLVIASNAPIDRNSNQAARLQNALRVFPNPRLVEQAEKSTSAAGVWPPMLPLVD
jgi:tetratricopeptide (TPR) repeat protein